MPQIKMIRFSKIKMSDYYDDKSDYITDIDFNKINCDLYTHAQIFHADTISNNILKNIVFSGVTHLTIICPSLNLKNINLHFPNLKIIHDENGAINFTELALFKDQLCEFLLLCLKSNYNEIYNFNNFSTLQQIYWGEQKFRPIFNNCNSLRKIILQIDNVFDVYPQQVIIKKTIIPKQLLYGIIDHDPAEKDSECCPLMTLMISQHKSQYGTKLKKNILYDVLLNF